MTISTSMKCKDTLLESFIICYASLIANGKFLFLVSGRKYAKDPIIIEGIPKTNIGKGFQTQDSLGINADDTPNILEIVDIVPKAVVLRFVG